MAFPTFFANCNTILLFSLKLSLSIYFAECCSKKIILEIPQLRFQVKKRSQTIPTIPSQTYRCIHSVHYLHHLYFPSTMFNIHFIRDQASWWIDP